jgi:hypothetical protein
MKKTLTLEDFPKEKTFICLKNELNKKLVKKAIKKAGSQRLLANKIKQNLNFPKIKQTTISLWLRNSFLRLDLVEWLNDYINLSLDLETETKQIKGESTSRPIDNTILFVEMSESLAIILANLYCDGTSSDKDGHTTNYYNQNENLLNNFRIHLKKVFGKVVLLEYCNEATKVKHINIPHFIGRLLYKKFKLYSHRVPEKIKTSEENVKSAYLRTVFDDEGTVSKYYGQIRLKMKYESYLKDIKYLLNSIGIECSNITLEKSNKDKYGSKCYYLGISGQYNLRTFLEKIGSNHPQKLLKLKKAVSKIKFKNYGYKTNKKILNALKRSPKTAKQLAYLLSRDRRTIHYHLNNLLEMNKVNFKRVWSKYSYEYLWFVENDSINNL